MDSELVRNDFNWMNYWRIDLDGPLIEPVSLSSIMNNEDVYIIID